MHSKAAENTAQNYLNKLNNISLSFMSINLKRVTEQAQILFLLPQISKVINNFRL